MVRIIPDANSHSHIRVLTFLEKNLDILKIIISALLTTCTLLFTPAFAEFDGSSNNNFSTQCSVRAEFYDPEIMANTMADPVKFLGFMTVMSNPETAQIMMACASNPEQWNAWMAKVTDPNKMMNTMAVFMNPQFYANWMAAFMNPEFYNSM